MYMQLHFGCVAFESLVYTCARGLGAFHRHRHFSRTRIELLNMREKSVEANVNNDRL